MIVFESSCVYFVLGDKYIVVVKWVGKFYVELDDRFVVNWYKFLVDVMFNLIV